MLKIIRYLQQSSDLGFCNQKPMVCKFQNVSMPYLEYGNYAVFIPRKLPNTASEMLIYVQPEHQENMSNQDLVVLMDWLASSNEQFQQLTNLEFLQAVTKYFVLEDLFGGSPKKED